MIIRIFLVLLVSIIIYSKNVWSLENPHPVGWNCAQWNSLDELNGDEDLLKILFMKGIYTGLVLGESPKFQFYLDKNANLIKSSDVDEFCKDKLNKNIPIVFSILVVAAKKNENDAVIINDITNKLRETFKIWSNKEQDQK